MSRRVTLTLSVLALLALLGAKLAGGATQHQVSLTATGPQPAALTVGWGDSVVFTNVDGQARTLLIPRLGVNADLGAGTAFTQVFAVRRGTYPFRERIGNKAVEGVVTVEVSGKVGLAASPKIVPFGRQVTVTGTSPYAESPVALLARAQGSGEWAPLQTVTPDASGSFSTRVSLSRGGTISATVADGQLRSEPVSVTVRPLLSAVATPRRTAAGRFVKLTARLRPANAASSANLERYDVERKRWLRLRTARIPGSGVATFSLRATTGSTRLRVVVPRVTVTPGYLAVTSRVVTVVGI